MKDCPACGISSPDSALLCDCGVRLDAGSTTAVHGSAAPRGLGGWLVLLGVGIMTWPLHLLAAVVESVTTLTGDAWQLVTTPGTNAYHPLWAPFLVAGLVVNIVLFVGSVGLVFLFFSKKRMFPWAAIVLMIVGLVVVAADISTVRVIAPDAARGDLLGQYVLALPASAIWMMYLVRSSRVKATFIN